MSETDTANVISGESALTELLEELEKYCEPRGRRAEVSRLLCVGPSRLCEWLNGKSRPGGAHVLAIQALLAKAES